MILSPVARYALLAKATDCLKQLTDVELDQTDCRARAYDTSIIEQFMDEGLPALVKFDDDALAIERIRRTLFPSSTLGDTCKKSILQSVTL